jgi:hypothetical protein
MIRIEGIRLVATHLAAAQNSMPAKAPSEDPQNCEGRSGAQNAHMNKAPQNDPKAETVPQAISGTLESPEPEHELRYVDTRTVASDCSTLMLGPI